MAATKHLHTINQLLTFFNRKTSTIFFKYSTLFDNIRQYSTIQISLIWLTLASGISLLQSVQLFRLHFWGLIVLFRFWSLKVSLWSYEMGYLSCFHMNSVKRHKHLHGFAASIFDYASNFKVNDPLFSIKLKETLKHASKHALKYVSTYHLNHLSKHSDIGFIKKNYPHWRIQCTLRTDLSYYATITYLTKSRKKSIVGEKAGFEFLCLENTVCIW